MAIGGLAAYFYFKKTQHIYIIHHVVWQVAAWLVLALVLANLFHTSRILDHVIVSLVTVIVIINQISNPKTLISLNNKVLNYIGTISYGLYIIHPLVILLLMGVYRHYDITSKSTIVIHLTIEALLLTFIVAHLSYTYYESRFLKLKQRFTIVNNNGIATPSQ